MWNLPASPLPTYFYLSLLSLFIAPPTSYLYPLFFPLAMLAFSIFLPFYLLVFLSRLIAQFISLFFYCLVLSLSPFLYCSFHFRFLFYFFLWSVCFLSSFFLVCLPCCFFGYVMIFRSQFKGVKLRPYTPTWTLEGNPNAGVEIIRDHLLYSNSIKSLDSRQNSGTAGIISFAVSAKSTLNVEIVIVSLWRTCFLEVTNLIVFVRKQVENRELRYEHGWLCNNTRLRGRHCRYVAYPIFNSRWYWHCTRIS